MCKEDEHNYVPVTVSDEFVQAQAGGGKHSYEVCGLCTKCGNSCAVS